MVGWILSVMAHEFSHAAVAWLGGDRTVAEKGYLSFPDPRRYGDSWASAWSFLPLLALAMGGIGFPGGAVYIRNDLIRSRLWRSAASLAGPAATLLVLVALAFGLSFWAGGGVEEPGPIALFEALTVLAFLQAMALILNLLPIPGLDGFGAIRPFLPASLAPHIRKAEGLVMVGLLLAIFVIPGRQRRAVPGRRPARAGPWPEPRRAARRLGGDFTSGSASAVRRPWPPARRASFPTTAYEPGGRGRGVAPRWRQTHPAALTTQFSRIAGAVQARIGRAIPEKVHDVDHQRPRCHDPYWQSW